MVKLQFISRKIYIKKTDVLKRIQANTIQFLRFLNLKQYFLLYFNYGNSIKILEMLKIKSNENIAIKLQFYFVCISLQLLEFSYKGVRINMTLFCVIKFSENIPKTKRK